MWEKEATEAQDFSCNLGDDQTTTITDTRDGNTYTVAKLADGQCWLTQNLRLGDGKLKNRTLTSNDTDLPSEVTYELPYNSTSGFDDNTKGFVYVNTNYGGYYSWIAATAGTGENVSSGNATGSICPKGWRLPSQTEFGTLISRYGTGGQLAQPPANFVLAGHYKDSSPSDRGSIGYYWSSTTGNSTNAYRLDFDSSSANVYSYRRYFGYSVRCVAREQ